jgi:hypothetical protein
MQRLSIGACCNRLCAREDTMLRRGEPRHTQIKAFLSSLVTNFVTHEDKKAPSMDRRAPA